VQSLSVLEAFKTSASTLKNFQTSTPTPVYNPKTSK